MDDFIRISNDASDAINALGNAAGDAIAGLTNVPTGYKLALARFNATMDLDADRRLKDVLSTGPNIDPVRFPRPGDGATLPLPGLAPSFSVVFEAGAIQQQPGEDVAALTRRIVDELRIMFRAQSGDTLQLPIL